MHRVMRVTAGARCAGLSISGTDDLLGFAHSLEILECEPVKTWWAVTIREFRKRKARWGNRKAMVTQIATLYTCTEQKSMFSNTIVSIWCFRSGFPIQQIKQIGSPHVHQNTPPDCWAGISTPSSAEWTTLCVHDRWQIARTWLRYSALSLSDGSVNTVSIQTLIIETIWSWLRLTHINMFKITASQGFREFFS